MIDPSKIEKLMELMKLHGVDILEVTSENETISLVKNASHAHLIRKGDSSGSSQVQPTEQLNLAPNHEPGMTSASQDPSLVRVQSPFVGMFYRSPSPETPPFIEVGQKIKKGQTLCIVEAMKLMNEIEADQDMEIVEILRQNGKPVEFGADLFLVRML